MFGWSEVASGLSCGRNGAWQLQFALHYVIRQSPRSVARKSTRDDAPRGLPPLSLPSLSLLMGFHYVRGNLARSHIPDRHLGIWSSSWQRHLFHLSPPRHMCSTRSPSQSSPDSSLESRVCAVLALVMHHNQRR